MLQSCISVITRFKVDSNMKDCYLAHFFRSKYEFLAWRVPLESARKADSEKVGKPTNARAGFFKLGLGQSGKDQERTHLAYSSPNLYILKLTSPKSPNFNIPKLTSPNSPNLYLIFMIYSTAAASPDKHVLGGYKV